VSLIQHYQTGRRRGRLPPSLETDVPERLRRLPPAELSDEQKEVYDAITGGPRSGGPSPVSLTDSEGGLHGPFNAMLLSPPLGDALQALGAAIRYRSGLTDRIREMAILAVAAHYDSAFERYAHEAIALGQGLSDEEVADLRSPDRPLGLEDRAEEIALRTVRTLLRHRDLDDGLYREASGVLGPDGLFELSTLVGYYATLALQLQLFRVGLPESAERGH
jgi:4-carboxymuconolactone decarboxylase